MTLDEAVSLHRQGKLPEAASAYAAILQQRPDEVEALQLYGLVLHRMGRSRDGLAQLERAVALDPAHPGAQANRGMVLRALGRLDDAASALRAALELKPGLWEAELNLARVEHARGNRDRAEHHARTVATARPEDPAPASVLAEILVERGAVSEAMPWLLVASKSDGRAAMALGQQALSAGRAREALDLLQRAVQLSPGDRATAMALADAVLVSEAPDLDEEILRALLAMEGIDHQRLERAVRRALDGRRADPGALLTDPLWVAAGMRLVLGAPEWESALIDARSYALRRVLDQNAPPLPLAGLVSLAMSAWWGEHVWETPADELPLLDNLDTSVPAHLAVLSAYRQLPAAVFSGKPSPLPEYGELTAGRLDAEQRKAKLVTEMAPDTKSSAIVREQYEESPYPRYMGMHLTEPLAPRDALARFLHAPPALPARTLDVLVAGCGTGRHALTVALGWKDVSVHAIDLSRRSLGRAAWVRDRMGVRSLTLARGDLLTLDPEKATYDIIEAVGVLHHLEDPLAGFRALRRCLRPGGLMRVGLYSERGRADVAAARALIAEQRHQSTPEGIRAARRAIMALPEGHPARTVVASPDFWSLAGTRDLLFHVREHLTSLPAVADMLRELDLTLLGLQHAMPHGPLRYRSRWPEDVEMRDISRWDELEQEDPRLFSGMYVLWCAAKALPAKA